MNVKSIDIIGKNHFETWTKTRIACRGLIIQNGEILLSYETKNQNQYMIPGGGLEENESEIECCKRELAEETGLLVNPGECVLQINEFYEEWKFVSYYFICKITGETKRNLTQREIEVGMEPRWIPVEKAIEIFSKHNDYAETDEMRRGMYFREYTALTNILKN